MSVFNIRKVAGRLIACLVFATMLATAIPAYANLTILPNRVILESRDRFAEVTLINTGDTLMVYNMGWRFFRMEEGTGNYIKETASVTPFDITKHIVFSPRRVTLQPGEKQKVRLALRLTGEEIPPGEYRGHLQFASEQASTSIKAENGEEVDDPGRIKAGININVGYSIPVFYTVGTNDAGATINSMQLSRNPSTGLLQAAIDVTRSGGPYSTHGVLSVYHQLPGQPDKLVGEIGNAHIFPEVMHVLFDVGITDPNLAGGSLRAVYRHFDKSKNLVYDEKIYPVN